VPKERPAFAGHYRGEPFPYLRAYRVGIASNSRVGAPPQAVRLELQILNTLVDVGFKRLDIVHAADSSVTPEDRLSLAVAFACRWFSQFLMIHPYANGNGHMGRAGLIAILHRYGYTPRRFTIEPRPFSTIYSNAIREYQRGKPSALETFILKCVRGDVP
jgi:hypothetical protein